MRKWIWIIIAVVAIGGIALVTTNIYRSVNFVEVNRNEIETNVKRYVELYKLDPEKVRIDHIIDPVNTPMGDSEFTIIITYTGYPYFSTHLSGNPETLRINERDEPIILAIFNELYLEERYEEFKPAIEHLDNLGIKDTHRPENGTIKYFYSNIGLAKEIEKDIREVFWKSNNQFDGVKNYIKKNKEEIVRLDNNIIDTTSRK